MKAFTYGPEYCKSAGVRLNGALVEHTDDPKKADVFVVPETFAFLSNPKDWAGNNAALESLPYFEGNEHRHMLLDIVEHTRPPANQDVIYFRAGDCHTKWRKLSPNYIPWPWPVEDLGPRSAELWAGMFTWDAGYTGYDGPNGLSKRAVDVCSGMRRFKGLWRDHAWGWQRDHNSTDPEYVLETGRHRDEYIDQVTHSRVTLEPICADGVWRYRFFESWSMARIPVHIGDHCERPFADKIPYDDLAIFIPEADVANAATIIDDWISRHSDEEILNLGYRARELYRMYLHRDRWPAVMADVVKERLGL